MSDPITAQAEPIERAVVGSMSTRPVLAETTERDRSPIEVVLNDLQNGTRNVHQLIAELTDRLRPVLREQQDMLGEAVIALYLAQQFLREVLDRLEV